MWKTDMYNHSGDPRCWEKAEEKKRKMRKASTYPACDACAAVAGYAVVAGAAAAAVVGSAPGRADVAASSQTEAAVGGGDPCWGVAAPGAGACPAAARRRGTASRTSRRPEGRLCGAMSGCAGSAGGAGGPSGVVTSVCAPPGR